MALSYVQLLDSANKHSQHWTNYNATLGATPFKLRGNVAVADLNAAVTLMQTLQNAVTAANVGVQTTAGTLIDKKTPLIPRVTQFRSAVAASLGVTTYTNAVPQAPQMSSNRARFTAPLVAVKETWTRVNADTTVPGFTPPLLLPGGYTLATLTTDLTALDTAYFAHDGATDTVTESVNKRNQQMAKVLDLLILYRESIAGKVGKTDPLFLSLPRLYPPAGGTPKAVTDLLYILNADKTAATITFTPSTSANLDRYEARFSPGAKYDATNEEVLATANVSDNPHSITIPLTAIATGEAGLFKIYTINKTDNEKGSKVLKIKRV